MNSPFYLQAVIEFYGLAAESACPWEIAKLDGFAWIRLSAEMTQPEIGLFFAQLAHYNQIDLSENRATILRKILAADGLVLAGGIQAVSAEQVISPSCCCGLEDWRKWQEFLRTGETPWLGHDPSPWLEQVGSVIRIWSDGGLGDSMKNAFKIEVDRPTFERALRSVEQDLLGFRFCIESWCESIEFEQASELANKVEQCFQIGQRQAGYLG
jgi:hypothetical protein